MLWGKPHILSSSFTVSHFNLKINIHHLKSFLIILKNTIFGF